MHPRQRGAEHRRVNPLLGAAALKAGLCLSHAVLDSLDAVPARQCPPRSHAPALQDDIGVDEDRADVAWHAGSQLHRRLDPVVPEQVGEVIDGQIQQVRRFPRRKPPFVDRSGDHLGERL